jgi:hypothetical protein
VWGVIGMPPDLRLSIVVADATGVIARACDCGPIEAFDRLQVRAQAMGQSLEHTALDVIDGVIRLGD